MRVRPSLLCVFVITAGLVPAADVQGVVIDRNCAQDILKHGRGIVLKRKRECSLMKNYLRPGYGIITDGHKFFYFDDAGNKKALRLLENTPDKDNLKVIVSGDIDGDTIKVATMSML